MNDSAILLPTLLLQLRRSALLLLTCARRGHLLAEQPVGAADIVPKDAPLPIVALVCDVVEVVKNSVARVGEAEPLREKAPIEAVARVGFEGFQEARDDPHAKNERVDGDKKDEENEGKRGRKEGLGGVGVLRGDADGANVLVVLLVDGTVQEGHLNAAAYDTSRSPSR